jgi:hypothetical protein
MKEEFRFKKHDTKQFMVAFPSPSFNSAEDAENWARKNYEHKALATEVYVVKIIKVLRRRSVFDALDISECASEQREE